MNITQQAAAVVKKDAEKDKGFTLIELLVVVVIIGILAAVAIPIFLSQKDKAADASVESDIKNASTYLETLYVDESSYANAQTYLDDADNGFRVSDSNTITATGDTEGYCIQGVGTTGTTFALDSATGVVAEGAC